MRHDVEARSVAHRRAVHEGIAGSDGIDLAGARVTRPVQDAVCKHRAFRPTRRSGGVEQPGEIVGLPQGQRGGVSREEALIFRAADGDEASQ